MSEQKFSISKESVIENIKILQSFMKKQKLDAFYVSSFDPYLNEYVPLVNCHRYYFSHFTGSTAELMVPAKGKVKLYVDGRYHEQADLEVDHKFVEVVKVSTGQSNLECLQNDLLKMKAKMVGVEGDRTALSFLRKLEKQFKTKVFYKQELESIVEFGSMPELKKIEFVEKKYRGKDTAEKLEMVIPDKSVGYFLSMLDSIAWITNCRGYHLPNLSCFMSRALVTKSKVYVFVDPGCPVSIQAHAVKEIEFLHVTPKEFIQKIKVLKSKLKLKELRVSPSTLNASDYDTLVKIFTKSVVKDHDEGLVPFHSIKDEAEMNEIRRSFKKSDMAIAKTIRWVQTSLEKKQTISELDFYHGANDFYKKEGAIEQSFKTIAATGPNASIIHYSQSSDKVKIKDEDIVLLDSGAYYEGGFATDTTRAFFGNPKKAKPSAKQIQIYTLVLKGLINALTAVVSEGTRGMAIDTLARDPLLRAGFDYAHGTGHGVGINVHEPGARFSTISNVPIKKGQVVSIEPGIYIPGFGGVRLENIIHVIPHPKFKGMVCFENLTYVGFDPSLIDLKLLTAEELKFLKEYEAECAKCGTAIGTYSWE